MSNQYREILGDDFDLVQALRREDASLNELCRDLEEISAALDRINPGPDEPEQGIAGDLKNSLIGLREEILLVVKRRRE